MGLVVGLVLLFAAPVFAQTDCEPPASLQAALATPSTGIYNALGGYFAERGRMDCAIPAFEKAIEMDADNWEPRFNLGLALAKAAKPRPAAEQLRAAVRLKPDSLPAKLALGYVLLESGDWTAAEKPIEDALAMQPQSPQALYGIAQVRMQQRRYASAVTYLKRALEANPDSMEVQLALGAAYANQGQTEQSIALLTELVKKHPRSSAAQFNLATAYARVENYPAAARHYQAVLDVDSGNHAARMSAAKALANFHKHAEVLALIERYSAGRPAQVDEFELHHLRGVALRGLGRYDESEVELLEAARLRPNHSDTLYHLGFVPGPSEEERTGQDPP